MKKKSDNKIFIFFYDVRNFLYIGLGFNWKINNDVNKTIQ